MSIKIMSHIWDQGPAHMTDRFVLLCIADYANDSGLAWPSIASICKKTTLSDRGVQKSIRRLEEDGWLEIETGNGRKGCNTYTIKTPNSVHPEPCSPPNMSAETPNMDAQNPEQRSPEPSRTIIEPSTTNSLRSLDERAPPEPPPKKTKRPQGTRLSADWSPSQANYQFAINQGMSHDQISRTTSQFVDYWISAAGAKARKVDWSATWRNWIRREVDSYPKRNASAGSTKNRQFEQGMRIAAHYAGRG